MLKCNLGLIVNRQHVKYINLMANQTMWSKLEEETSVFCTVQSLKETMTVPTPQKACPKLVPCFRFGCPQTGGATSCSLAGVLALKRSLRSPHSSSDSPGQQDVLLWSKSNAPKRVTQCVCVCVYVSQRSPTGQPVPFSLTRTHAVFSLESAGTWRYYITSLEWTTGSKNVK